MAMAELSATDRKIVEDLGQKLYEDCLKKSHDTLILMKDVDIPFNDAAAEVIMQVTKVAASTCGLINAGADGKMWVSKKKLEFLAGVLWDHAHEHILKQIAKMKEQTSENTRRSKP